MQSVFRPEQLPSVIDNSKSASSTNGIHFWKRRINKRLLTRILAASFYPTSAGCHPQFLISCILRTPTDLCTKLLQFGSTPTVVSWHQVSSVSKPSSFKLKGLCKLFSINASGSHNLASTATLLIKHNLAYTTSNPIPYLPIIPLYIALITPETSASIVTAATGIL